MVAHILRGASEVLAVVCVQDAVEGLADHALLGVQGVGCHVRHLEQHGGDQVDGLNHLQGDVHVEGHLAALLHQLLLRSLLLVLGHGHTLCKQLLDVPASIEVIQACMCLNDEAIAECCKTQLSHGPVVQDLRGDVHVLHAVLQVAHQQHVASTVEVIMDGLVVDGAKHGAGLGALITVAVDQRHQLLQDSMAVLVHDVVSRDLDLYLLIWLLSLLLVNSGFSLNLLLQGKLAHGIVDSGGLVVEVLHQPQGHLGHVPGVVHTGQVVKHLLSKRKEDGLVLEASQVLMGVRIDHLQALEHLVIQALHKCHQVAPDLDLSTLRRLLCPLLLRRVTGVIELIDLDVGVVLQELQHVQQIDHAFLPERHLEVAAHAGVQIEEG
mmetsp:Transcript_34038/g.75462  ORF Transcript_34038/g.75462 Transcript_34038/m.75462 type:complete len:380 (+) Transcript_34038:1188-2327(+)